MNVYATAVLISTVAVTTFTQASTAQAQTASGPAPVEAFYCSMQEGKNMKDVVKVTDKFSKWAAKNDPSYSAWLLTLQFGMRDQVPPMIWLGSNPNGTEFGKGLDAWQATGDDLQAELNSVMDCSIGHVLASSVEINVPAGPPGDGVVMFTQCSIDDGSDAMKAIAAHKAFSASMQAMGGKGSSWMFFPMLGGGERDFDYFAVSAFKNWSDYGAAYDMYVGGGGRKKAMEINAGVLSSDQASPTVWDVKLVHQGKAS